MLDLKNKRLLYELSCNSRTHKIIMLSLVATILILSAGCTSQPTGPTTKTDEIKIGFASALSGEGSVWGEAVKKGFDFALEEINARGGIKGQPVRVVYEDDNCEAVQGTKAFNKLINIDKVKIISGSVCSSVALSVAPKTQENNVLYIATGATHPDVTKQGDLVFRMWTSDSYETIVLANYAVNNLNLNTFAIAHINDNPAGIAMKDEFSKEIKDNKKEVTRIEGISSKEKDFKTQILKLMHENPDAIYIMPAPEQTALIINQLRELGYKGTLLVYGPSITTKGIQEDIVDKTKIYYAEPKQTRETDFWQRYREKTGQEADLIVAAGYDSMKIIADGLRACGEDNSCIREYLLSVKDYQTSRGKISFDNTGNLIPKEFEIKKI